MTDIENLQRLAISLHERNSYWAKWGGIWAIAAYLRDRGICQYCGCNLFESYESLFGKQELDHLLPKTRYPQLETHIWNLVTACRLCNNLKSHWDPNKEGGTVVYDAGSVDLPSETQYFELLGRARSYVSERRKAKAEEFLSARNMFETAIASSA
jgi:hypothetical protein